MHFTYLPCSTAASKGLLEEFAFAPFWIRSLTIFSFPNWEANLPYSMIHTFFQTTRRNLRNSKKASPFSAAADSGDLPYLFSMFKFWFLISLWTSPIFSNDLKFKYSISWIKIHFVYQHLPDFMASINNSRFEPLELFLFDNFNEKAEIYWTASWMISNFNYP